MKSPCCGQPTRIIKVEGRYAGAVVRRRRICSSCGKAFTTHESLVETTAPRCAKKCGIVAELTQKVEECERLRTKDRAVRTRVGFGAGAKS